MARPRNTGPNPNAKSARLCVHRCRFVEHMPSTINALAFSPAPPPSETGIPYAGPNRRLLACARANGDLEIWNPFRWHLERVIPGVPERTIESVLWLPAESSAAAAAGADDSDDSEQSDDDDDARMKGSTPKRAKLSAKPVKKRKRPVRGDGMPRLFTAGLDGYITEWDLTSLRPKNRAESQGGAVWCMTSSPLTDELLVGCEDGRVRAFSTKNGGIELASVYDKQDGRILSISHHPTLPQVTTGSTDSCIRTFSSTTFRCLSRSTVDTASREETLVWAVAHLPDGTLVSGDSLGAVSFWDTKTGALRRRIRAHKADVLALAVGSSGVVFSSGIDRKVIQYKHVEGVNRTVGITGSNRSQVVSAGKAHGDWVVAGERRYHSHDVRALALCDTKPIDSLVSGGVDTILTVSTTISSFPSSKQIRHNPFPQRPLVSVARNARFVMYRHDEGAKVWMLGDVAASEDDAVLPKTGTQLTMLKNERLLADIKIVRSTNVTCAAISSDGRLVAIADRDAVRLFRLVVATDEWRRRADRGKMDGGEYDEIRTVVTKIKNFPSPSMMPGAIAMTFTPDSKRLIVAGSDSVVRVVDVAGVRGDEDIDENGEVDIIAEFNQHAGSSIDDGIEEEWSIEKDMAFGFSAGRELVSSVAVSSDGQWLATGDLANRIHIFSLDALRHHVTLPRFSSLHTTLSFHAVSASTLHISTCTNEIYIYDVEERRLSHWSRSYSHRLPERFLNREEIIMGIDSWAGEPNKLVAWAANYTCTIDLSLPVGAVEATIVVNDEMLARRAHNAYWSARRKRKSAVRAAAVAAAEKKAPAVERTDEDGAIVIDSDSEREVEQRGAVDGSFKQGVVDQSTAITKNSAFQMKHQFGPLMFFGFVGEKDVVAVERPLLSVIEKLPAGYYRKRYGT